MGNTHTPHKLTLAQYRPIEHLWRQRTRSAQVSEVCPDLIEYVETKYIPRSRRAPLAKMFSVGMITRLEDDIHNFATRLCDKLLLESGKGPLDITVAYSCFASDVIFEYCFGESNGFLDQDGWYPNFREPTLAMLRHTLLFKFFPFLVDLQPLAVR